MASTIAPTEAAALTDAMLARFASRSPKYDRENAFFTDDFDELRAAGYLKLAVPAELGGRGFSLAEVVREQRRLGSHAPDAQRRHDPGRRVRRRSPHSPRRAGRRRGHRPLRARALRVGAPRLRQHLLRPGAPRLRGGAPVRQVQALDRALTLDGLSRG